MSPSADQQMQTIEYSHKQMKFNPSKNNPRRSRSFQVASRPTENLAPTNYTTIHRRGGSVFIAPPTHYMPPPLLPLPLPISNPQAHSLPCYKSNHTIRTKPLSSTSKKSVKKTNKTNPYVVVSSSALPLKNDPQKVVSKVLSASVSSEENVNVEVLAISPPPPSSLPLPKFFLRPKIDTVSRTVQAVGVDTGATDNLRRILRLR